MSALVEGSWAFETSDGRSEVLKSDIESGRFKVDLVIKLQQEDIEICGFCEKELGEIEIDYYTDDHNGEFVRCCKSCRTNRSNKAAAIEGI